MPRVLRQLRNDHVNMAKLLDLLDSQVRLFDEGGAPDYDLILDIMDYTMNYPDRCHHPIEDLVFRKLMARNPASRPVVEELLEEHAALARRTKQFAEALERVVLDAELPREEIAKLARDYVAVNRRHMEREERTVLPLVRETLEDDDWAEIEAALRGEDPLFGERVHQQYLALHQAIVGTPS